LGIAWDRLTLDNFRNLLSKTGFARSLLASSLLASVTATLATLICAAAGYALARLHFRGKRGVTWLVLACLIIPGPLLLSPGFQVLYHLSLLDTFMGLACNRPGFRRVSFQASHSLKRASRTARSSTHGWLLRVSHFLARGVAALAAHDRGLHAHHIPGRVEQLY
jgi:hypothetical protein